MHVGELHGRVAGDRQSVTKAAVRTRIEYGLTVAEQRVNDFVVIRLDQKIGERNSDNEWNVAGVLFLLLLGLVGGYFRYKDEAVYRSTPYVASITADSENSAPFSLLTEPRALPDLHIIDGTGAVFTLADMPDTAVVFSVWATWCVPCRTELRELAGLLRSGGLIAIVSQYQTVSLFYCRCYRRSWSG